MKASAIAQAVNGRLEGGSDPDLTGAAPLDYASGSDLSLLSSARYASDARTTRAGAILVTEDLARHVPDGLPSIVVADPRLAMATLLPVMYPEARPAAGIDGTAIIEAGATIGHDVRIGAYAVIGAGTRIGDRVVIGPHTVIGRLCRIDEDAYLHPQVSLYDGVQVGARTILHSGVRAGVDGFGYTYSPGGHVKVPQVGRCVIGADVEIGANTCIDRGSIGSTVIGDGCKIDNQVHIGHNVRLGEHCIVVAQVGISGSSHAGRFVSFGGQSGVAGHVRIGDGASIGSRAAVWSDIPAGQTVSGEPARPHRERLRETASIARLPELIRRLRALERTLPDTDSTEP